GFNDVRGVVNLKSSAPDAELAKLKDVVDARSRVAGSASSRSGLGAACRQGGKRDNRQIEPRDLRRPHRDAPLRPPRPRGDRFQRTGKWAISAPSKARCRVGRGASWATWRGLAGNGKCGRADQTARTTPPAIRCN